MSHYIDMLIHQPQSEWFWVKGVDYRLHVHMYIRGGVDGGSFGFFHKNDCLVERQHYAYSCIQEIILIMSTWQNWIITNGLHVLTITGMWQSLGDYDRTTLGPKFTLRPRARLHDRGSLHVVGSMGELFQTKNWDLENIFDQFSCILWYTLERRYALFEGPLVVFTWYNNVWA